MIKTISFNKPPVRVAWLFLLMLAVPHRAMAQTPNVSKLKTFGTIGKEVRPLKGDSEAELFRHEGKGCLTHMWFGGGWKDCGKTRIRIYVDREDKPSIDMQLFLGHGIGFEDDSMAPWGTARIGKIGTGTSVYNTYRIPFGTSIRVTAQQRQPPPTPRISGGSSVARRTFLLPWAAWPCPKPATQTVQAGRLHRQAARRIQPLRRQGSGGLYQVTMAAKGLRKSKKDQWKDLSYMEACMRAYIGRAKEPLMLSSGLEDYFLGTYYFNRGRYATAVAGLTHFKPEENEFSAYRFHEDDPVFFQKGLRLTCRCGEKIGDKVFHDPPPTRYTTYTWVYQW